MKVYLELGEVERLEHATTCLRDRLLIRLLARLGCRVSEALVLAVDDIDFNQGTVRIEHLKSRLRLSCPQCGARLGKSHAFCPKCGQPVNRAIAKEKEYRRMRTLPIDDETLKLLRHYIERGGAVLRAGKKLILGTVSRYPFPLPRGRGCLATSPPLSPSPLKERLKGLAPSH